MYYQEQIWAVSWSPKAQSSCLCFKLPTPLALPLPLGVNCWAVQSSYLKNPRAETFLLSLSRPRRTEVCRGTLFVLAQNQSPREDWNPHFPEGREHWSLPSLSTISSLISTENRQVAGPSLLTSLESSSTAPSASSACWLPWSPSSLTVPISGLGSYSCFERECCVLSEK